MQRLKIGRYLKLRKCPCTIPQRTRISIHFGFLRSKREVTTREVKIALILGKIENGPQRCRASTLNERSSSKDNISSSKGMKYNGYFPMVTFPVAFTFSKTCAQRTEKSKKHESHLLLGQTAFLKTKQIVDLRRTREKETAQY